MDRQRLAAALAYEEERRRRMMESVPVIDDSTPTTQPRRSLRSDLENLSSGLGQGIVNQLEGVKGLITDPVGTAKGVYEAGRAVIRDPSVIADALRYTAQKAASGPLGAGEVIGEMIGPRKGGPVMQELDVYHGTPHRFPATEANPLGEFDASKIGTGEGAQAYGHGVYLAESPDVAKSYRFKQLTGDIVFKDGTKINVLNLPKDSPEKLAAQIWLTNPNLKEATTFVQKIKKEQWKKDHPNWENPQQQVLQELEKLNDKGAELGGGSFYKADLPDEMVDRMLDWDKPLSRQSKEVQEFAKTQNPSLASEEPHFVTPSGEVIHWSALVDSVENLKNPKTKAIPSKIYGGGNWVKYGEHMMGQTTGGEFYRSLSSPSEWSRQAAAGAGKAGLDDVEASAALRAVGIPGIMYLDAGSRGQSGSGTRNFVVFPGEEKKVRILERK